MHIHEYDGGGLWGKVILNRWSCSIDDSKKTIVSTYDEFTIILILTKYGKQESKPFIESRPLLEDTAHGSWEIYIELYRRSLPAIAPLMKMHFLMFSVHLSYQTNFLDVYFSQTGNC